MFSLNMESEKVPSPLASPRTLLPALPLAQPLASSSAMPQPIDLLVDIIKRQPSVRLPDVDGEPLSVNVPIDSVLRELLKQPAIRNWAKIEEYIVTALSSIKNQNESTSTYDGESREYFLKKYIKHRARHRSMMKFLGEDERITIAREKDLSYLTEIGQTGRGGIIDGTNNRIDKTRNTTQTIFGDSESTITQTLSRPEEKKAESDETMVINTNNTDNGNVHAVYAESFKQLEQSVGIINKNDIQSSKNAEKTSRASIKNKTIKPKNIHNPPGPSSAVNSQQLTGLNSKAYGCREVNILLTRINCPTKRIIISSVSNRDKKEKRSADNENCNATSSESPKISGKKVINQNNDEDFQGRGSNLTNNFNTLCTESLDQLRKNYVHVSKGLKDTRLELQEKVPM